MCTSAMHDARHTFTNLSSSSSSDSFTTVLTCCCCCYTHEGATYHVKSHAMPYYSPPRTNPLPPALRFLSVCDLLLGRCLLFLHHQETLSYLAHILVQLVRTIQLLTVRRIHLTHNKHTHNTHTHTHTHIYTQQNTHNTHTSNTTSRQRTHESEEMDTGHGTWTRTRSGHMTRDTGQTWGRHGADTGHRTRTRTRTRKLCTRALTASLPLPPRTFSAVFLVSCSCALSSVMICCCCVILLCIGNVACSMLRMCSRAFDSASLVDLLATSRDCRSDFSEDCT